MTFKHAQNRSSGEQILNFNFSVTTTKKNTDPDPDPLFALDKQAPRSGPSSQAEQPGTPVTYHRAVGVTVGALTTHWWLAEREGGRPRGVDV